MIDANEQGASWSDSASLNYLPPNPSASYQTMNIRVYNPHCDRIFMAQMYEVGYNGKGYTHSGSTFTTTQWFSGSNPAARAFNVTGSEGQIVDLTNKAVDPYWGNNNYTYVIILKNDVI